MLSMPTQAIHDYLVELSMSNPLLEIPESPTAVTYEGVTETGEPGIAAMEYGRERDYYRPPVSYPHEKEDTEPSYSRGSVFEADTLTGSLTLQLSLAGLTPEERAIGMEIIGNLDESGYFIGSLTTICLLYCVPEETGQRVLSVIQGFTPRGIAAANVYESLCLQVEDSYQYSDIACEIIKNDLAVMYCGCSDGCAKKYRVSTQVIEEVFDYIRALEPRPGNCDEGHFDVSYISPDIIVRRHGSELSIFVSGDTEDPLNISEYYLDMLGQKNLEQDERKYLRSCLNEAKALIHSVDIRRQTLHRFALALLSLQSKFFRYGPEFLQPLTMQRMANEMGVNISTVSRVVQDKYASTPWGEFPLKYFFTRSASADGTGTQISTTAVKQRINDLISAEDPYEPVTDEQIGEVLKGEGVAISRRTVTKYRQASGIPSCGKRRHKRS